jgi:hypothetical protein
MASNDFAAVVERNREQIWILPLVNDESSSDYDRVAN